jgi:hypothetical protein
MNIRNRSRFQIRLFPCDRTSATRFRLWTVVAIFFILSAPARAAQVRIPLTIDYLTLREALKRQLYTAPGGRAELWNGLNDCQFLYAENPNFARATAPGPATVKLETNNSLALGVAMGSRCLNAVEWSGIVEALGVPYIAPGLQLKFHFTDLNVYDSAHQKTVIVGKGFDLIKSYLIPRLDDFTYDLRPAVQQLAAMATESIPPDAADRLRAAIASLTAEPGITALDEGIRITLVMTIPDAPAAAAIPNAASSPTPAELKAFQDTLDQWDAFMVFSITQLGDAVGDQQFRDQLLQILLDSRYRLVQALNSPPDAAEPDPVRALFLDQWRQLHDAVRAAAARGMLGPRALEFMSFISAGDALFALDQAAPALGMRISAADLRRLAHIMAPTSTGDPLEFNYNEDPNLKKLFAVPEPPTSHHPIEEQDIPPSTPGPLPSSSATSTATPSPSPTNTASLPRASVSSPCKGEDEGEGPITAGYSARDSRFRLLRFRFPFPLGKGSGVRFLSFLSPLDADAAEDDSTLMPRLQAVADRLYRLVVTEANAEPYRTDMSLLLNLSAEHQLGESGVDTDDAHTYTTLVLSTAWQESCWRQFVMDGARIRWLESATGDIGLMQVNKHVWRGFYDIDRLKWDVLYNAGAGCEILARMMRYAIAQPKFDPVPVAGHLARSAYAAYNGGPGACNRWRRREPPALKQIDTSFWEKYHAIENGTQIDILSCARTWSH